MPLTIAIRANIDCETVKYRTEIKQILSEMEGRPIGRISDSLVVTKALKAYHEQLKVS